jgi:tetratricopeptide (TPR) repeat protein
MNVPFILLLMACAGPAIAGPASVEAARKLIAKGSTRSAVEMLRPIVAADPSNADARLLLGTALALQGMRSESIQQLTEAVKLRPDSAGYNTLGMALSRFAETGAAREAFEKAIQLDPKMAGAHVNLALILAQSGELRLAGEHLDRAIRIEGNTPPAARAHYLRAGIHGEQNELEAALAELERAVLLRPDFAEAWSDLGTVRRALLDEAGALSAFERAVRIDPENTKAQFRLGSEYLHSGKPHQAVEHLSEALRRDPDQRAALYNLQMALREDGQIEEAKRVEARMAELLRQRSRASEAAIQAVKLNNQGVESEKAGDLRAALEKYRAALELDPEHGGFRLNLGLALCRLGRWDEGIAEMREVVRRDPDNAEATKALYIAMEQQPKSPVPAAKAVTKPPQ